ncbi:hypothetical protein [Bacteroides sp.]|uniref:hypothetical protein n=1 Tax=Bacteroides sp. TaxID=29523 RepID=UPI001DCCCA44|nr:hypothetical protein [Bacteroides sp.]MBS6966056.1 DUF4595 domain-containing protein [Bacteroides sp.]
MKTFRLIGMALLAVVMCVNFASCSDDEDENNDGGTVVSGKLLRSMSEDDNNNYLFSYNEKKQLISATLGEDKINVKWSDSDIIVETISTSFKEEPANFIIKNGIITSTVGDKETETLTYDNNKHLIKISGDKTCMWSWENDNISKFSYNDAKETSTLSCTYYADKENKHSTIDINALRLYFICGIEYVDLLLMAHPNLLGTTNKNLLKSVTSSDGWTENYSYEIDKEGYPTKIIVTETDKYDNSYSSTYTLIWQ